MSTAFRRTTALGAVVVLALAVGCSKKSSSTLSPSASPSATQTGASLSNLLPASIKAAGKIRVASDISYAPIEFFKTGTQDVQGVDFDIAQALGAKLGVTFEFKNQNFATIIPALQSGKFDIIMSAMTDNTVREKTLDFVDYFTAGTSILVKQGNPQGIKSLTDLCGKTVAMEAGTVQVDFVKSHQKDCTSAGKQPMTLKPLPKDTDAQLAVRSGQAVADINDAPVAAYNAKTAGGGNSFEVVIDPKAEGGYEAGPYGIGILKADTQLRDAIHQAMLAIIADGTYDQIMTKWGTSANALKTAKINGAV